jgi:WD40 repeat protein
MAHFSAAPAASTPPLRVPGYEILEELGRGGMGVVHKARQQSLNRLVALKVVLAGSHTALDPHSRFRAEAEGLARLHHPHIVQIYEIGEHEGLPFFSMELVEGGTLDRQLNGHPLAPRQAAALVETLARAVHHAHQQGVVHRDLKPANVLLARDGTPKIADFGLAKFLADAGQAAGPGGAPTGSGAILGTPSYMAPEQAGGKRQVIGPRADVWALGAILYECLTGQPPYKADTPLDTILKLLSDEPVPPLRLQGSLPRDLDTICLKCLQKEPRARYGSAAELADDLRRFLDGLPVRVRPIGNIERLSRWCRRNPLIAALVAAVAVLLVAASVISTAFALRVNALRLDAEQVAGREREAAAQAAQAAQRERAASARAEDSLLAAEALLYHNRLARAAQAWQANEVRRAEQWLDECLPAMRHWEWHYLKRLCRAELQVQPGPPCEPGRRVASSRDGSRLAVIHKEGFHQLQLDTWTVTLWDTVAGRELRPLGQSETEPLRAVALSPDGRQVAISRGNGRVQTRDADKGTILSDLAVPPDGCDALAYDASGGRLAGIFPKGAVKVFDAASGRELFAASAGAHLLDVVFRPDGQQFATSGADGVVKVWAVPAAGAKAAVAVQALPGHAGGAAVLAYSPDGSRLAAACRGGPVKLWAVAAAKEILSAAPGSGVEHLAFSPDGTRLALACQDGTVHVWDGEVGGELFVLHGHTRAVQWVGFHGDGRTLMALDRDEVLRVWDAQRGLQGLHLPGPSAFHAFSPDGRRLAKAALEGRGLAVWDLGVSGEAATFRGGRGDIQAAAFGDEGLMGAALQPAALLADLQLQRWDPASRQGTEVPLGLPGFALAHPRLPCLTFTPDGRKLAAAMAAGVVLVFDTSSRQIVCTLERSVMDTAVLALAFSADGKWIAVTGQPNFGGRATLERYFIHVHDAATGALVGQCQAPREHSHRGAILGLCFSPSGSSAGPQYLASAGADQNVLVWDLRAAGAGAGPRVWTVRQPARTLRGHTQPVRGMAFSPDGRRLASVSCDDAGTAGEVKLWDVALGEEVLTLGNLGRAVSFSPDGLRLAVSGPAGVTVFDGAPGRELLACHGAGRGAAYQPDGVRLASWGAGESVKLWDAGTGRVVSELKGKSEGNDAGHAAPVRHAAYSPDGTRLATADAAGVIKIWDVATMRLLQTLAGHTDAVVWLAFSPDGRRLASASSDETARVWDVETSQQQARFGGHEDRVLCVAFSPDGRRVASAGEDCKVRLWDAQTGTEVLPLEGHDAFVNAVAFSPDGTRLVSASDDATARMWDLATGKTIHILRGHRDDVRAVAWSPDGRRLATAGWDGRAILWDAAEGKELFTLGVGGDGLLSVVFSPDGKRIAWTAADETVRVWDAEQ